MHSVNTRWPATTHSFLEYCFGYTLSKKVCHCLHCVQCTTFSSYFWRKTLFTFWTWQYARDDMLWNTWQPFISMVTIQILFLQWHTLNHNHQIKQHPKLMRSAVYYFERCMNSSLLPCLHTSWFFYPYPPSLLLHPQFFSMHHKLMRTSQQ